MKTFKILNDINLSGKPYVIYKTSKGYDLFTDFSEKIILSNKNIINFLNSINLNKKILHGNSSDALELMKLLDKIYK